MVSATIQGFEANAVILLFFQATRAHSTPRSSARKLSEIAFNERKILSRF
jgi:hypothetical protein